MTGTETAAKVNLLPSREKRKTPEVVKPRGFELMPGSDLLSHRNSNTIVGAEQFHFRVRDGIGWFPLAIAARQAIL